MQKKIKKFFNFQNSLVTLILLVASFLRFYKINDRLGFWYDQGRDALVIWDLIKNGKLFLIGPTTGIAGIFRGPYYYYLIAPFYWISGGNPILPQIVLILLSIMSLLLIYLLGVKIQNRATGIIALIFGSFSLGIIGSSQWLSNPTPMLLLSMIFVWSILAAIDNKKYAWPIIGAVTGLSLFNFGSSGELFYIPAILIVLIWQWKNRPNLKYTLLSLFLFVLTFIPLVFFDIKHKHILFNNLVQSFGSGSGSFKLPTIAFILERSKVYLDVLLNIFSPTHRYLGLLFIAFILISFITFMSKLINNQKIKVIIIILLTPLLGLYFYQGNNGVLYGYYLTGYYLIFILFASIVLGHLYRYKIGKVLVFIICSIFLINNIKGFINRTNKSCNRIEMVCLADQKLSINWIYENSQKKEFNVDVYVPPVIPYAYDYLFKWLGTEKYHILPQDKEVGLLYTLYEDDVAHPERLKTWLNRQKGIGIVIKEAKFGMITVQERQRILYSK